MVSSNKKTQFNDYMKFVQNAINGEIEDPLREVYAGAILGKTQFIKNLLDNLKDEILKKKEITGKRELQVKWEAETIIKTVADSFKNDAIPQKRNKIIRRNVSIYLLKKHTTLTNKAIGELLGDIPSTTVSKTFYRFSEKLTKTVKKIEKKMSHVEV